MHKSLKLLGFFLIFSSPLFAVQISNSHLNQRHNFTFFNIPLKCNKTDSQLSCAACCKTDPDCPLSMSSQKKQLFYNRTQRTSAQTPLERAREVQQEMELLPEEKMLPGVSSVLYQCPNSSTVLFEQRYEQSSYYLFQFRTNGSFLWKDFCGESAFKDNPHLFDYICGLSDDTFFSTNAFPSVPVTDLQSKTTPKKSTPAAPTETHQKIQKSSFLSPKLPEAAATPIQLPSNAWNVLGDYFYPTNVPGNLSNMRRFETKNKTKEIKINFSSKNKQPFLEKLKEAHRYHPARQTDCAGGSILYEAVSNGIYQAYILSENAITVFSAAYSLPTLPEEPHAARMQQEFCGLDVNSKW